MPKIHHPRHFPHMLYWTTAGLIEENLSRNIIHPGYSWLTESEMDFLEEGFQIVTWPGEMDSSEIVDTDSDSDDDNSTEVDDNGDGDGDGDMECTLNWNMKFGQHGDLSGMNNPEDKKFVVKKLKRKSSKLLKLEKEIFGEDEVRAIDGIVLNITMADITGCTKYHRGFSHLFPQGQFH